MLMIEMRRRRDDSMISVYKIKCNWYEVYEITDQLVGTCMPTTLLPHARGWNTYEMPAKRGKNFFFQHGKEEEEEGKTKQKQKQTTNKPHRRNNVQKPLDQCSYNKAILPRTECIHLKKS